MKGIESRLKALEATTEATAQPQSAVVIYDAKSGQEITKRPASAKTLVFIPDNGRGDRQ